MKFSQCEKTLKRSFQLYYGVDDGDDDDNDLTSISRTPHRMSCSVPWWAPSYRMSVCRLTSWETSVWVRRRCCCCCRKTKNSPTMQILIYGHWTNKQRLTVLDHVCLFFEISEINPLTDSNFLNYFEKKKKKLFLHRSKIKQNSD